MRNLFKRSERANRSRRPNRGVSAVAAAVASAALVAGLASYPVGAQVSDTNSTISSAVVADAVTVDRSGNVDRITIRDTEDNPWDSGRKASEEYIWGVKREGAGEITRIISVVADGVELEPEFYGFVNGETFDVIGIDEDALSTLPPFELEIEVETTGSGAYSIAEADEVPTAAELSRTGYGINASAAATVNPAGVGTARATGETKWSDEVQLSSPIIGTDKQRFPNIGTEPYFEVRPTGELPNQVGPDIRITRIVVRNIEDNSHKADDEAEILKNEGAFEQYYFPSPTQVKDSKNRVKGFEAVFFDPKTGNSPVSGEFIIHSGKDSLKIGVDGVGGWDRKLDVLQSRYVVEVYGSFRVPVKPSTSPKPTTSEATPTTGPTTPAGPSSTPAPTTEVQPTPKPEASPQGETTLENGTFRVVAKTDPNNPFTLSAIRTTGANPYRTIARFDQRTKFSRAVVEVKAPNSILATEQYGFSIDLLESGVQLERKVLSASKDSVTFEVYPVRNGQRIDSALVEKGANLTAVTRFNDQPKNIDVTITVEGVKAERENVVSTVPESRPAGEKWLEPRLPNPGLPEKCGLKIAVVADLSTSLRYADTDGFIASRNAAKQMVDTLAGTSTEIGVYHFARQAGADTDGAVSVQDQSGVGEVKRAIDKWTESNGGATNWEAGLKQVQGKGYDVVYFITDGMPTWDDTGWQPIVTGNDPNQPDTGAYVQAKSVNQAIKAANQLKMEGTRIVPLMVELKLKAGNPVTRDYVLKDVLPNGSHKPGEVRFQRERFGWENSDVKNELRDYAVYKDPGSDYIVNMEIAVKAGYWNFLRDTTNVTDDPKQWTWGTREVKQLGEDISGAGQTIDVKGYTQLAAHLTALAEGLKDNCEGTFTVQKRIVKADGSVEKAHAEDWTFAVNAGAKVLDLGNNSLTSNSTRTTSAEGNVSWRTVNADSTTFSVVETRKDPYRIFQRDGANAVCSIRDTADSTTSFNLPITNNGEDGIKVNIPGYSHVTCVFDNYEPKDEFVKLELEKLDGTDNTTLSNAEFEVRSERKGDGPYLVTWDEASQTYKTEAKLGPSKTYYLVETKTPTKEGQRYSLLVAPVEFQIVAGEKGYVVQIRDGEEWTSELVGAGLWTERPQEFDAATGYLQVANVRQGNLPKTGGSGLQLPILLGGALIAAGALMGRRKVAA
ncbi:hypothetical protein A0K93_09560 [Corynebacterium sp. BCW_4722]|nr:hypothetical protein A0K93_09560 [Corynebacterium sp. BCW_4722]